SDGARYAAGERVMAFLRRAGDGTYFTASMQMGKFEFARNAQGASVLVRDAGEFGAEPARLESEFKEFVRGSAAANYQTKLQPVARAFRPKPVVAPAVYCATATAGSETHPIRWPGGESGFTVHLLSTAADPGGGIAAGAAAWTNEPAAFINLSYD